MPNPDLNNPSEVTSEENRPQRVWVWHSTENSIAAGQISVLAVVETLLAMLAYIGFAFYLDAQWWLLVVALAAPLILLRSPESKALGVKWLGSYWMSWNSDKKCLDLAANEKVLLVVAPIVITGLLIYWLAAVEFNIVMGWELAWRAFLFGAVAGVFAIAVDDASLSVNVSWFMGGCIGLVLSGAVVMAGVVVGAFVLFVAILGLLTSFAFAVWLRALLIRVIATFRHSITGIKQLPNNWREVLWCTDPTYPPELLPGASQVSAEFSLNGLVQQFKQEKMQERLVFIVLGLVWYPPALLYRWSLKATLWLWFPLALLLRPHRQHTLDKRRTHATTSIWISKWLFVLAVVTAAWLATSYFSMDNVKMLVGVIGSDYQPILEKLLAIAVPPQGLLRWSLFLCCGMIAAVFLYSRYFKLQSPKALSEEDALASFSADLQQTFEQRAKLLARLYTVLVVSFVLVGYSVILHLANQYYPQELYQLLPFVESWKAWL